MTVHQQHCFSAGPEGGYVHSEEEGCPPAGKAYFERLSRDMLKYNLETEEEATEARRILDDAEFETYYHLRGAAARKGHDEAIQAIRRLGPGAQAGGLRPVLGRLESLDWSRP
ncbi:hypothetical protein E1281_08620 [Actinomadura sp. KC345]|uniref:hypothetical protein n=1 Tax=Actinomadura sp. KC345 TaxID=2530371 RepID=UPI0010473FDC|nr:hypothetical protein [Actinomadura sp. KC345]TDC56162.1 hypothetical protein E1281_08620 [Actinomadura sp. KC345]